MLLSERRLRKQIRTILQKSVLSEVLTFQSDLANTDILLRTVLKRQFYNDFFSDGDVAASGLTRANITEIGTAAMTTIGKKFYAATKGGLTAGIGTNHTTLSDTIFGDYAKNQLMKKDGSDGQFGMLNLSQLSKHFYDNYSSMPGGLNKAIAFVTDTTEDMFEVLAGGGEQAFSTDEFSGSDFSDVIVTPFEEVVPSTDDLVMYVIKDGEVINGTTISGDTPVTVKDVLNGDFLGAGTSGGGTSGGTPLDPATVPGSNIIEKIEYVLNKYIDDIGGTDPLPAFAADPNWDGDTDKMYVAVLNHGFGNHTDFKRIPNAGTYASGALSDLKWKSIVSADLRAEGYPGCTGNPAGLLNFLVDLYNGDTTYSSIATSGSGGGGTSGGGGGGGATTTAPTAAAAATTAPAQKTVSVSLLRVPANENINTLEDLGFAAGTTAQIKKAVNDKARGANLDSGKFNFTVTLNKRRGRVFSVTKARGQRSTSAGYEGLRKAIATTLKANSSNKTTLSSNAKKLSNQIGNAMYGSFEIVIEVK